MPIIGTDITKKIDLPTTGAYVVIITNPKANLWSQINDTTNNEQVTTSLLTSLIIEWNFTLADGTPAPITEEMVDKALSVFDVAAIMSDLGVNKFLSDAKKNS